ncbi:hypothetical protein BaRGS_00034906 [Batillaria attramentaria]|uniref:Uncharacterized protein n=1 Tax=Batillaria attramentaria TaxID=370345 RepID=A0ABD0JG44_9CAEN
MCWRLLGEWIVNLIPLTFFPRDCGPFVGGEFYEDGEGTWPLIPARAAGGSWYRQPHETDQQKKVPEHMILAERKTLYIIYLKLNSGVCPRGVGDVSRLSADPLISLL